MDIKKTCITKPSPCSGEKIPKCLRKQNLLVYEKNNPCFNKPRPRNTDCVVTPVKSKNIKKIKVCTGADLKRMCPPKVCECPPQKGRKGLLSCIGRILGFGVKGALAGGLVYWTYQQGLWGRPDETEQLYIQMCKYIRKPSDKDIEKLKAQATAQDQCGCGCDPFKAREAMLALEERELRKKPLSQDDIMAKLNICQKAPSIKDNTNCFKNCWNHFILTSFDFLLNLPDRLFGEKKSTEEECIPKKKKVIKEKETVC